MIKNEYQEEKLQCPYVPAHQIAPDRMLKHLHKCTKDLANTPLSPFYSKYLDLKVCRWSALHRIPSKDIAAHELNCPDQRLKDVMQLKDDIQASEAAPSWTGAVQPNVLDVCARVGGTTDENWDDECGTGGYDTEAKVEKNPELIYNKQGLSRSQKRAFRHERAERACEQQRQGWTAGAAAVDDWDESEKPQKLNSPKKKSDSGAVAQAVSSDDWTTVPSSKGRGRAQRKPQESAVFDNIARGLSGTLPAVEPKGRGRGRGRAKN